MDLITTYIQRNKDETIADNILQPCKEILSNVSDHKIPNPNDERNQMNNSEINILILDCQYFFNAELRNAESLNFDQRII